MAFTLAAARMTFVLGILALLFASASSQLLEFPRDEAGRLASETLRASLATAGARTLFPGSSKYDDARAAWNTRSLYRPVAFVFPTTIAHVQNAIYSSVQAGVGIMPRGGGHSFEDYSLGGRDGVLVVDMAGFQQLSYDKATKTAAVGAGWKLGPLFLALWNAGKVAIPAGNCLTVGIAGHTLGGGWGFTSRKFGMVSDNLLEAELVMANGTVVTANANHNSDLFFALRGAGAASFGIVTQFTFRVHDVSGPVTHFEYTWNVPALQVQNLKAFQTWSLNLPREITATFLMDAAGRSRLEGTYLGPLATLPPLLTPFLSAAGANPEMTVEQLPWIELVLVKARLPSSTHPNILNNPPVESFTSKGKSSFVKAPGLSDAGIDAMMTAIAAIPKNVAAFVLFDLYGSQSAINQVDPAATAFVHRKSLYAVQMVTRWDHANEKAGTDFIENLWNAVRPHSSGHAYQNYVDRDMPLTAYYGSNLNVLIAAKRKWDPKNVFNFAQSIPLKGERLIADSLI